MKNKDLLFYQNRCVRLPASNVGVKIGSGAIIPYNEEYYTPFDKLVMRGNVIQPY